MIRIFKKSKTDPSSTNFLGRSYQMHNVARLAHLDSLGLDLSKKEVLEIGAGIGDHTYFYLIKGCEVTATDARPESIKIIKQRFEINAFELNVEKQLDKLKQLERFDIIHCYGLLYHIKNPKEFLLSLKGKCDLFLLETCVSHDFRTSGDYIVEEDKNNPTQAFSGLGCRPTRDWIESVLRQTFTYVYFPDSQPNHSEFPKDWSVPVEDREKFIRAIYVCSSTELANPNLTNVRPILYK